MWRFAAIVLVCSCRSEHREQRAWTGEDWRQTGAELLDKAVPAAPAAHASRSVRYVSPTGKFSVETRGVTLVRRDETRRPDGSVQVEHWIRSQDGETRYDATCFDGTTAAELAANVRKQPGMLAGDSQLPGFFFANDDGPRDISMRIIDIGGRGCRLEVAGPTATIDRDASDAFMLSIRPEP